ncbi:MAG: hypothetical protein GW893_08345 [Armatimonadetes bacterium]|nr:hypothetical protein [Armatimonadota bacterium]
MPEKLELRWPGDDGELHGRNGSAYAHVTKEREGEEDTEGSEGEVRRLSRKAERQ